jgi:hypothetical protein
VDHILFKCHLARLVWCIIGEIFLLNGCPDSLLEFNGSWLLGKGPLPANLLMFFFAGFAWTLWSTHNKMVIEKHFPKAPTDVIYVALSLMQKWSIMLKEGERKRFMQVKDAFMSWLKNFKTNAAMPTDVFEL